MFCLFSVEKIKNELKTIKYMTPLKILIIFTLLISFKSISQDKEYIVTNNNDTIYGKVIRGNNVLNPSKVIFNIKDDKGKKTIIDPSETKAIRSLKGVDGDCFIVTIYDDWFLKKIIDGRIKIYQLIDGVQMYVSKDDSEIMSTDIGLFFTRKKSHAQIRPLLEDNKEILKEYDALEGSIKNIFEMIEKYNKHETNSY